MNIRKRTWMWQGEKRTAWVLDSKNGTRRLRKQFATKQEAELYRDKMIRSRYAHEYDVLLESSFPEFLKIYEAKKPWRTDSYRERVMSALKLAPFDQFPTVEAIEQYRNDRLEKSAPSTVRQDLAALHDCLKWAVKLKYLHTNPAREVERPSLPVKQDDPAAYLTPEEFGELLAATPRRSKPRDKGGATGAPARPTDVPLYKFAVWTGLRITELLALEWPDTRDGYVVVRRGKGRKQRIVPLLPQATDALKEVPRRLNDARVFWWMQDRHTTLRRFQRRLEWAKLPRFRFHDLRHTFGAYAAQAGVDLEVIAAAMGHTSTTVTKLYAHLSPAYKRNQLMKMASFGTPASQGGAKLSSINAKPLA